MRNITSSDHMLHGMLMEIYYAQSELDKSRNEENRLQLQERIEFSQQKILFHIQNGFDINSPVDGNGNTLLHEAVRLNLNKLIEFLFRQKETNINVSNVQGVTPILLALTRSSVKIIFILLHHNADLNLVDADGNSSLHYLAKIGASEELFREIFFRQTNKHCKNIRGLTAFDMSVQMQSRNIIKLFFSLMALAEADICKACLSAIHSGKTDFVIFLFDLFYSKNSFQFQQVNQIHLISEITAKADIDLLEHLKYKMSAAINLNHAATTLLSHPDRNYIKSIISNLHMSNGRTPILTAEMARIIFAAKQDKSQENLSVVVVTKSEFAVFIERLADIKSSQQKLRIQFVITSAHWLAGELLLEENCASLFLIDPLGGLTTYKREECRGYLETVYRHFPNIVIYCSFPQIQYRDNTSCTLFAIKHALMLRHADRYLPKNYHNLYEYLEDHKVERVNITFKTISGSLIFVVPPLRLLQFMQFVTGPSYGRGLECFFTRVEMTPEEKHIKVNKKAETLQEVANRTIKVDDFYVKNNAIESQLKLYSSQVLEYMLRHNKNQIENAAATFGVDRLIGKFNLKQNTVLRCRL